MKFLSSKILVICCLMSLVACSQNVSPDIQADEESVVQENETKSNEPHRYGGWYCPDNLGGFPPVDIKEWENVPVVNGRMPTKEELQGGASLIDVDLEKYPDAKVLDITLPKLASYYNRSSKREDLVIVIQAINVDNDSIVGFRYLNGGNGSSRLKEVRFLSEEEIDNIPESRFVTIDMNIETNMNEIWKVLTLPENSGQLQKIFDPMNLLEADWRESTNVNFNYPNSGNPTAGYGNLLFGNFYIQNDYEQSRYTEKFFLSEDEETKHTEFKIVCGSFGYDFEIQKTILETWARKVRELSEKR